MSTRPSVPAAITAVGAIARHPGFVLGPIDLAVTSGEIVALVGANGAGKSTLLDLLSGNVPIVDGSVDVGPPSTAPAVRCGHLTDADDLPGDLTANELWNLIATLVSVDGGAPRRALDRAARLAERLRFDQEDQFLATLSHGSKQKAKLVATLMVAPERLVLDEPRNGLDPVANHLLDELVAEVAASGVPVVVATHDLHYAERAASRIIALHRGVVRYDGPTDAVPGRSLSSWYVELATGRAP